MAVKNYELFHGVVLTKLVRNEIPVALSLIETMAQEFWAMYIVNDAVALFVKHRTRPRNLVRVPGGLSWTYVFNEGQIRQIQDMRAVRDVYVALVGGNSRLDVGNMQVCLLYPDELDSLLGEDFETSRSVTVKYLPRHQLLVSAGWNVELKVPQNRLDTWQVPGG